MNCPRKVYTDFYFTLSSNMCLTVSGPYEAIVTRELRLCPDPFRLSSYEFSQQKLIVLWNIPKDLFEALCVVLCNKKEKKIYKSRRSVKE
jgi:hypothetical protein